MDDNTAEGFQPDTPLLLPGGVPLELVRIPAGPFRMGQRGGRPNEEPVHEVVIAHEFWLGATPATGPRGRARRRSDRVPVSAMGACAAFSGSGSGAIASGARVRAGAPGHAGRAQRTGLFERSGLKH
jgi:hypothetical protein